MNYAQPDKPAGSEIELTDADILDAMRHIPGYLDITTADFREIYRLAHRHALERLFGNVAAARLMRTGISPLAPDLTLDRALKQLADSGYKGLPVADAQGRVIGMLTETDFLRRLRAKNFPDLLLQLMDSSFELVHRCHETPVSAAMSAPAVTVGEDAGFAQIVEAFSRHPGRGMPVVNREGRLAGLLLRKDFVTSCNAAARTVAGRLP
jgi:CBS domain-containing membrane protein